MVSHIITIFSENIP